MGMFDTLESIDKIKVLRIINKIATIALLVGGIVCAFVVMFIDEDTVGIGVLILLGTPIVSFVSWFINSLLIDVLDDIKTIRINTARISSASSPTRVRATAAPVKSTAPPAKRTASASTFAVNRATASPQKNYFDKSGDDLPKPVEIERPKAVIDEEVEAMSPQQRLEHFYKQGVISQEEFDKVCQMSELPFLNYLYNKDMITEAEYDELTAEL